MRYIVGLMILFISLYSYSQEENFGMYTNMSASDGHFGGFEILYVPNDKVIFQEAEGWPKDPIILDMKRDKDNGYFIIHPDWGQITLEFENDKVKLDFVASRYSKVLTKGQSFWQK